MTIIEQIAAERQRQVDTEGWTAEHDDRHKCGEMAQAAICYAQHKSQRDMIGGYWSGAGRDGDGNWISHRPRLWPWHGDWWKPATERRNLIKAAALIVAEIERLDRAKGAPPSFTIGDLKRAAVASAQETTDGN